MPNGYGFGFRGSSPPWPYIGRGRGGLPRCWYPWAAWYPGVGIAPTYWQTAQAGQVSYPAYGAPLDMPYYEAAPAPGAMPFAPQMTKEQELDFLKNQAEAIKGQLEQIDARMREMESEE